MKVTLPAYQDQKSGLLTVSTESGNIHQSYLTDEGYVVVFEFIPCNFPASAMAVYENLEEYVESIQNISWVNDQHYVISEAATELEELGYPFN